MIFSKEFKSTFGKMIAWLLVIGVLTGILMAFYPLMLEDRMKSIFDTFINGLSDNLAAGLGFNKELDYSNISTYLAFVFQYIAVLIGIFAFQIGAKSLAKEEETGSIQYIYSNPISRSEIVSSKLLSGVVTIFLFLILLCALSFGFIKVIGLKYSEIENSDYLVNLVIIFIGMLASSLVFMGIGYFISSFTRSAGYSETVAVLFIIIVVVFAITGKVLGGTYEMVASKLPFEVFHPYKLISHSFDLIGMGINGIIFIISIVLTYVIYGNKEFKF